MIYRIIFFLFMTTLTFVTPALATFEEVEDAKLKARLAEVLKDQLIDFRLVKLQVDILAKDLVEGQAVLPVVDMKGQLIRATYPAEAFSLRSVEHKGVGVLSSGKTERPDTATVKLPDEQLYQLGKCGQFKEGGEESACGNLTILDQDLTMAMALSIDPENGMSILEPVNTLLGETRYQGIHLVYNLAFVLPIDLECDVDKGFLRASDQLYPNDLMRKQTNVILECDGQFYAQDPATVWSRMDAIWSSVRTVYGLFQAAWHDDWRLYLPVIGHQGWLLGFGPSATNKVDLSREIEETRLYYTFTADDLHHFFVGYDVSGVLGRAGGIGSAAGGIGGGGGHNHAYSEARTTMTHFAMFIVAAHEAGHLLGGVHGDGSVNMCIWPTFCGPSIMLAGSGGAPDTRVPFFSSANSNNMESVISAHLDDWP